MFSSRPTCPQKPNAASLRAGLVFFRNGQRLSDTPMVEPAEYNEKTRTASFRISLPLSGLNAGATRCRLSWLLLELPSLPSHETILLCGPPQNPPRKWSRLPCRTTNCAGPKWAPLSKMGLH